MRSFMVLPTIALSFVTLGASETVGARFKAPALAADGAMHWSDIVQLSPVDSQCAKRLSVIPIADTGDAGLTRFIDRSELMSALSSLDVGTACIVRWDGPNFMTVRKPGKAFDIEVPREQIRTALTETLKQRFQDVEVIALESRVKIVEGSDGARFEFSVPADLRPQKRVMIAARLVEQDGHSRAYPLWYSITAHGEAFVLDRALAPGQTIAPESMHSTSVDVASVQDVLLRADADLSSLISKVPLPAGTVLRKSQFVTRPEIEVGDRVSLRYHHRDVSIEATGVALQSSRSGQRVLVRAPVGDEVIAARTIGQGVAEILQ